MTGLVCNGGNGCCDSDNPCSEEEGDCDWDNECFGPLVCGTDNCEGETFDDTDDCCELPAQSKEDTTHGVFWSGNYHT